MPTDSPAVLELSTPRPAPGSGLLALAVPAAAAVAVYAHTLAFGFVWDDWLLIVGNRWLDTPQGLAEGLRSPLWGFVDRHYDVAFNLRFYRPLGVALLYALKQLGGGSPWPFHLAAVLGHAANATLVAALARGVLSGPRRDGLALLAGLAFAVHPVHVEAVAWSSGLFDVWSTLGCLAAAALTLARWQGTPERLRPALVGVCWGAACLLKEGALLLPPLLWSLSSAGAAARGEAPAPARERLKDELWPLLPWLVLVLAGRVLALQGQPGLGLGSRGWAELVWSVPALLAHALSRLVWSYGLDVFEPFQAPSSPGRPDVVLGLALGGALAAGWWAARRRGRASLAAGLLWLVLPLSPVLVLPWVSTSAVADRYLYLPSVGFVLLAALAVGRLLEGADGRRVALVGVLVALLTGVMALDAVQRSGPYSDQVAFYQAATEATPDSAELEALLGLQYGELGDLQAALQHLRRAVALDPRHWAARMGLGVNAARAGQYQEALAALAPVLERFPGEAEGFVNRGLIYKRLGRLEEATADFTTALRLDPRSAEAHVNLGMVLSASGHHDQALAEVQRALELRPAFVDAEQAAATIEERRGNLEAARAHRERAAALKAAAPRRRR